MAQAPVVQFGGSGQNVAKQVTRHAAGFLVASDLLVSSAAAVKDAQTIEIVGRDGQSFKAEVVRSEGPLALLKVQFSGAQRAALPIATAGASGTVVCPAFPSPNSIFDDEAGEIIENVTISASGEARMKKHPRSRQGSALGQKSSLQQTPPDRDGGGEASRLCLIGVKVDAELQTDFATETGTMRSWLESQEVGASVSSFAIPLRQTVSSSGP